MQRQKNRSKLKKYGVPVQFLGWCPPFLGPVARQFLGWSPGGLCPHLCSSREFAPRETAHRVSLWCFPCRRPLSRKVHGVNAIGAPAESHAPLRRAGGCMPSTWCLSPGEHVSDETAHSPSLSQRVPALGQHCVRRFAVASNTARVAWVNGSSAVRTRACPHATGNGATVGRARGGLSTPSNQWILPVFGKILGDSEATLRSDPCNNTWFHGPPLVSSQGVVSPPLPNGCGRELHGPHLYRDQRDNICGTS